MSITQITVHADINSMGDTTEQDAAGYRAWLKSEIEREFPGADVTVDGKPSTHGVETDAEIDDYQDYERLQWFVQAAWNRCPWSWVAA